MTIQNADIARVFEEIAALLELADENPFKVRAYRNAAQEVETLSFDIASRLAKGEELPKIWGYGFLAQAEHQPLALTSLPLKMSHGPQASPALPLKKLQFEQSWPGWKLLNFALSTFAASSL
jgi:hypothetical protein